MTHRLNCNGVVHLKAYFALTDFSLKELTRLSQMTGLLGRLPTDRHDALSLQLEIRRWIGSLGFAIITRAEAGQDETCTPYLAASASALEENAEKAQELLAEILTSTRYEDRDRMTEMFRQNEMGARQRILGAGHQIGVKNVLSHFSAENAVRNALDGDAAAAYIHQTGPETGKGTARPAETGRTADEGKPLCRRRMTVSVTSTAGMIPEKLIDAFPEGTAVPAAQAYHTDTPMAAGFRIPAQTGFAVRGYRLSRIGIPFEGVMWLASSIL